MAQVVVTRYETPAALAASAARVWLRALEEPEKIRGHWACALSGGRIARRLFESVAEFSLSGALDLWRKVDLFWADERCVGPEDEESNYRLAEQSFLKPLGVADERIHRIRGEVGGHGAAEEASDDMLRVLGVGSKGWPELDLVILGMGEDGHVASLFPAQASQTVTIQKPYKFVIGPKPPPQRVTLVLPVLAAARRVMVLVSGAGKGAVLDRARQGDVELPIGQLFASREVTHVFVDESSYRAL